jgi:hypothetical protein
MLERRERYLYSSVITTKLFASVVAVRLDLAITETRALPPHIRMGPGPVSCYEADEVSTFPYLIAEGVLFVVGELQAFVNPHDGFAD